MTMIPDFSPPADLSRKRKAALIVQMLLSGGGKIELRSLPEHLQETLAMELSAIRLVDRDTVNAVAEEFIQLLSAIGLSAPGGPAAAIDALTDVISPNLASRLRDKFGASDKGDQWLRIINLEVDALVAIMAAESVEVCAVALSKLPVEKAAGVLTKLPGERARAITFAVSQTADISADAIARIGAALVEDHCKPKVSAFEKGPVDRVGAILNSSPSLTREDVLQGLDTQDQSFAKDVRKAIFTFADIPIRLAASDVPAIVRIVNADMLSTALAAALQDEAPLQEAAEFVLSNISQRMASQMREDAAERGSIKRQIAEDAMNAVTTAIRAQVDAGEIAFVDPDEEEEEAA